MAWRHAIIWANAGRVYGRKYVLSGPNELKQWPTGWTFIILSQTYLDLMTSSNVGGFRDTGPLWGETTGDRLIPLTKGQ